MAAPAPVARQIQLLRAEIERGYLDTYYRGEEITAAFQEQRARRRLADLLRQPDFNKLLGDDLD